MFEFLLRICKPLEQSSSKFDRDSGLRMVEKVKASLRESEALPAQTQLFRQILLAILNLDFPEQMSELANELNRGGEEWHCLLLGEHWSLDAKIALRKISFLQAITKSESKIVNLFC